MASKRKQLLADAGSSYDPSPIDMERGASVAEQFTKATLAKGKYHQYGEAIGLLVERKQTEYGDSVGKSGRILAELYPNGVAPYQYDDVLLTVRVLDKLSRIAQRKEDGQDLGGESPWRDIAGYGLLGQAKDEA